MTIETVRQKIRDLRISKRRTLVGAIALVALAAVFYAFGIIAFPAMRIPFTLEMAWAAAGAYFVNHGTRSATMPGDAAWSTGIEFYRGSLNRRRTQIRRALVWFLAPVLLAIGTFLVALAQVANIFQKAMPFMALVAVWVVAYLVIWLREQSELRREIEELDQTETLSRRT